MEKAILKTLVYHDLFDYPLLSSEVWRYLILKSKSNPPAHLAGGQKAIRQPIWRADKIQNLIKKQLIEEKGGFYFLRGKENIVRLRKRRERESRKKLLIAKKVVKFLQWIPTIKMIGVTGAVAVGNAKKTDDIDFLIVVSPSRLWLTRILAVLLIEVLGRRRRPTDKKVTDKICLNIFLEENHLRMPKGKQNLFVAHEIEQMKVLFDSGGIYERFLRENKWVGKFLANAKKVQSSHQRRVDKFKVQSYSLKFKSKNILYPFSSTFLHLLDLLEKFAYRLQLKYMKSKMTSEQVSPYFAFFHPEDVSERIIKEYKKRFKLLLLSLEN